MTILLNSHDGTSSYQMLAGVLRFACQNGMVAGENVIDIRVPHKGDDRQSSIAYRKTSQWADYMDARQVDARCPPAP